MAKKENRLDSLRLRHSWSEEALADHLWDEDGHVKVSVLEILSDVAPSNYESDFICDVMELIAELTHAGASRLEIARQVLRQLHTDIPDEYPSSGPAISLMLADEYSQAPEQPREPLESPVESPWNIFECALRALRCHFAYSPRIDGADSYADNAQLLLFDSSGPDPEHGQDGLSWKRGTSLRSIESIAAIPSSCSRVSFACTFKGSSDDKSIHPSSGGASINWISSILARSEASSVQPPSLISHGMLYSLTSGHSLESSDQHRNPVVMLIGRSRYFGSVPGWMLARSDVHEENSSPKPREHGQENRLMSWESRLDE